MENIIKPPSSVQIFPSKLKWKHDTVDYKYHEHYYVGNKFSFYNSFTALLTFSKFFIINLMKRLIKYELIPLGVRSFKANNSIFKFINLALNHSLGFKTKNYITIPNNNVGKLLCYNGISVSEMSRNDFSKLEKLSKKHFSALIDKRSINKSDSRDFDDSRLYLTNESASDLFTTIEDIFKKNGIILGASYQLGRDVKLIDVNPQINDKSDNFWSTIYEDVTNFKLPITSYFHRDASGGDLKVIIYMNDVTNSNGPFSYCVGSNNVSISKFDDWVCETNDSSGFSSTTKSMRINFSKLPKILRQKGSFGNDLPQSSTFAKNIRNSAWEITGKQGTMVMFDTKGTHRGGMVSQGERRVLTCILG